jgi:hypothetical protein
MEVIDLKKYQIVAQYDDHIVVMDVDAHFSDFSTKKEIEI